jgi:SpoVK/Ycf46/Vps4 family AAA+-type ATPase
MEELVGMDEIKAEIKKLAHLKNIQEEQEKHGIKSGEMGMHMVITGNPGTGKPTVARILGELFNSIGLLPSKHLVETQRKDLVGEFVGTTAPKTAAVIEKAMGGVLFLDEAYSLAKEDAGNDFGKEAIDTLLKALEDDRGKFIFIAAGYKKEMDRFINANPGLKRRIKYYFDLPDYKPDELTGYSALW